MLHKDTKQTDIISSLPKDLIHYFLFRFFSAKDVKKNLRVSKQWRNLSQALLDKTAHQQFYLVGEPIPIAIRKRIWNYRFLEPRKDIIQEQELKNAFPNSGKVKLFSTEQEALNYSYSLRIITDIVKQPAIYKVQFLQKIPEKKRERIHINLNYGQPLLIATPLTREREVQFFETDIANVVPLSGLFKVSLEGEHHYKEYAVINYKKEMEYQNEVKKL